MRAIWTGAIGFGLVNIPVKLYSATQDSNLDLDMLDKKDHAHIKYKRVNESTGKEVKWDAIVKGYNLDGNYVILTDKDFESVMAEKTKLIEITDFVEESEINSLYYETPYFLEPEKSGSRPYALLREALKKTGKVGLGTFVLRNKEHLVLIKAEDNLLILNRIRFADEIRDHDELHLPPASAVKAAELKMATALVEQLAGPFDSEKYKDEYNNRLMKLIENKAKGKKVTEPKMKVVHKKTQDLMAQLKASLGSKKSA
ncbi:MAG: Ku protein [Bacteroidota bacterium]